MADWKKINNWIINLSLFSAIMLSIALWETGTFSRWGKIGIVLGTLFAPSFFLRAYRMWDNRKRLQETYEMAKDQFSAIKKIQKMKKGGK